MARGGKRPGAGRPKGSRTKLNEEARRKALEDGISPLDYLLNLMRDEQEKKDVRLDAAKAAAPYVHAKLSSVDVQADVKADVSVSAEPMTPEEWAKQHADE